MHRIFQYELTEGASNALQADLDAFDAEVVSTSTYVNRMQHAEQYFLVVVAREIEGGSTIEVAPRQKVSPASGEADVAAFDAWVAGVEPEDFAKDLESVRRDLPA